MVGEYIYFGGAQIGELWPGNVLPSTYAEAEALLNGELYTCAKIFDEFEDRGETTIMIKQLRQMMELE